MNSGTHNSSSAFHTVNGPQASSEATQSSIGPTLPRNAVKGRPLATKAGRNQLSLTIEVHLWILTRTVTAPRQRIKIARRGAGASGIGIPTAIATFVHEQTRTIVLVRSGVEVAGHLVNASIHLHHHRDGLLPYRGVSTLILGHVLRTQCSTPISVSIEAKVSAYVQVGMASHWSSTSNDAGGNASDPGGLIRFEKQHQFFQL